MQFATYFTPSYIHRWRNAKCTQRAKNLSSAESEFYDIKISKYNIKKDSQIYLCNNCQCVNTFNSKEKFHIAVFKCICKTWHKPVDA